MNGLPARQLEQPEEVKDKSSISSLISLDNVSAEQAPAANAEQEIDLVRRKLGILIQRTANSIGYVKLKRAMDDANGDDRIFLQNVEELAKRSHKYPPDQLYGLANLTS